MVAAAFLWQGASSTRLTVGAWFLGLSSACRAVLSFFLVRVLAVLEGSSTVDTWEWEGSRRFEMCFDPHATHGLETPMFRVCVTCCQLSLTTCQQETVWQVLHFEKHCE